MGGPKGEPAASTEKVGETGSKTGPTKMGFRIIRGVHLEYLSLVRDNLRRSRPPKALNFTAAIAAAAAVAEVAWLKKTFKSRRQVQKLHKVNPRHSPLEELGK